MQLNMLFILHVISMTHNINNKAIIEHVFILHVINLINNINNKAIKHVFILHTC